MSIIYIPYSDTVAPNGKRYVYTSKRITSDKLVPEFKTIPEMLVVLIRPTKEMYRAENPRSLQEANQWAVDSVAFSALNNNGDVLVVRMARKYSRCAEVWVYFKLSSGEEYQLAQHPDCQILNTDGQSYSAGGLQFEVLEPFKRWRLTFNGQMRKGIRYDYDDDTQKIVNVKFNFIWSNWSQQFVFKEKCSISNLAKLVCHNQSWANIFRNPTDLCNFGEDWYGQWGQCFGTVQLGNVEPTEIRLWAHKYRSYGIDCWQNIQRKVAIHGHLKDGTVFYLESKEIKNHANQSTMHGYLVPSSNFNAFPVTGCNFHFDRNLSSRLSLNKHPIQFTAGRKKYSLRLQPDKFGFKVFTGTKWDCEISIKSGSFTLNGKEGFGVIELARMRHNGNCPNYLNSASLPFLHEPAVKQCTQFVLTLSDRACRSSKLVGGKGASLSIMTALATDSEYKYTVPPGICTTFVAYQFYLQQNASILEEIRQLQNIAWNSAPRFLEEACNRVQKSFLQTELPDNLKCELKSQLRYMFKEKLEETRFAVRSSGFSEDGDELSAAGQNDTFLGLQGMDELFSAVIKCWASQFSFRSIEYKRQNGQSFQEGMGIVIQEMVPADVAGVLFTRNPLTGEMDTISISSSFGLGETVVSAAADPDTTVLKRSWDNMLSVHEKLIGEKRITTVMTDHGGTAEKQLNAEQALEHSLSDNLALRLGKLALFMEKSYGSPRDIEWAVKDNDIFLLQCRPVTTQNDLTDYEVIHEFDSAVPTDYEFTVTANVREVVPGALTPLTLTTVAHTMRFLMSNLMCDNRSAFSANPTVTHASVLAYSHFMIDGTSLKISGLSKEETPVTAATDMGVYGRPLNDRSAHNIALDRFDEASSLEQIRTFKSNFIQGLLLSGRKIDRVRKKWMEIHVPVESAQTAEEAYTIIESHLPLMFTPCVAHFDVSIASVMWNLIVFSTAAGVRTEYSLEDYNDFSVLIGSSNGAESGNVPISLKEIASAVHVEGFSDTFTSITAEEALQWLKSSKGNANRLFQDFLRRHGHRGQRECELRTKTWGMEPLKLVVVLQNMLKQPGNLMAGKPVPELKEILNELNTLSSTKKKILSFVVPRARNAIVNREKGKSCLIKFYQAVRLAFYRLADLMTQEGRLPEKDLLFFLTFTEIGRLLKTRSPRLIMRAKRRRRLYAYMDGLEFPELNTGLPKPVQDEVLETNSQGSLVIQAYPVCQGVARGTARVIVNLEDAHHIQPGDILVTHATDIGWSPYFPMLSGVVTEIGGLVSHGVVVAREYGIPCLVAARNATKLLQSGDQVLLNANNGTLERLSETKRESD